MEPNKKVRVFPAFPKEARMTISTQPFFGSSLVISARVPYSICFGVGV